VLKSGDDGWILVRPNRSLTRTGLLVATAACLSALMPATLLCALLGAWLVLPFVGLEVIVALGAFVWLAHHRDDHERIVFNAGQVLHQRVDGRHHETHRFPRYWCSSWSSPAQANAAPHGCGCARTAAASSSGATAARRPVRCWPAPWRANSASRGSARRGSRVFCWTARKGCD